MDPEEHSRLEDWAKSYAVLALMGFLSSLLVLGKVVHHLLLYRGFVCRIATIPPAIISGVIGLIWLFGLQTFDPLMTNDLINGLQMLKLNLVNFVFAALTLGLFCTRNLSQHLNTRGLITSICHEGMPMVIYSQILMWGQSCVCLLLSCALETLNFKVPYLLPAIIPLAIEAGGEIVPNKNQWSQSVVQEAENIGLFVACIVGIVGVSLKYYYSPTTFSKKSARHHIYSPSVLHSGEFESFGSSMTANQSVSPPIVPIIPNTIDIVEAAVSNTDMESNEASVSLLNTMQFQRKETQQAGNYSSLGTHLSLIFLSVFVAFNFGLFARVAESRHPWLKQHRLLSGIQMFEISIIFSLIVMVILLRHSKIKFRVEWFMRLCGLMLDLLTIAALATAIPRFDKLGADTSYGILIIYVIACALWNVFTFVFLAKRMFPNFWFERGITLTGEALGHSYFGLLLVRTIDPAMTTPVPVSFVCKLMLFLIPSSGGKNTIVYSLVVSHGSFSALIVCVIVVVCWAFIFEKSFRKRYVNEDMFNDHMSLPLQPASVVVGNFDQLGSGDLAPTTSGKRRKSVGVSEYSSNYMLEEGDGEDNSTENDLEFDESDSNSVEGIEMKQTNDKSNFIQNQATNIPVTMSDLSSIVSASQIQLVSMWLPSSQACKRFVLKYSLRRDGASMETLLNNCVVSQMNRGLNYSSCVLLVEDSWGYIFGAYFAHTLQNSSVYYGNGECFVFSLVPKPSVYRWTGQNDYFIITSFEHLIIGGGSGFALQLDDELNTGVSSSSETFNNLTLSSNEYFKCLNVEVWTLEL